MALIGYIRVSTQEQNLARQEKMMKDLNVDKVFVDKCSGKNTDRPQLKAMLEYVRDKDCVVVESYSRLSRSVHDLLNIVKELEDKKVSFRSLKEDVDTSTPGGKLMMNVFASIYQFEREMMLQRQKEGIEIAKKAGKYKGRQPIKFDKQLFMSLYSEWKNGKFTARAFMDKLGLQKDTFYRRIKEYEKEMVSQIPTSGISAMRTYTNLAAKNEKVKRSQ